MQDIDATFAGLRAKGRLGLIPFIPAGYPDLATTAALLPALERAGVCERVRGGGLATTLMIAPPTPEARRREIAKLCSGFVYYLSVSGITGERDRLPADLEKNLRQLRSLTDRPICVGFGISK